MAWACSGWKQGFWFLARDLNPPAAVRALNPGLQGPVVMTRPVSCAEMNFHIEKESSETIKVFIRRRKGACG